VPCTTGRQREHKQEGYHTGDDTTTIVFQNIKKKVFTVKHSSIISALKPSDISSTEVYFSRKYL